jgi:hypothetical protein
MNGGGMMRGALSMNNLSNTVAPSSSSGGGYAQNSMADNPLLKMMEKRQQASGSGGAFASNSMSENPLLKMMAANQKAKNERMAGANVASRNAASSKSDNPLLKMTANATASANQSGKKTDNGPLLKVGVDGSTAYNDAMNGSNPTIKAGTVPPGPTAGQVKDGLADGSGSPPRSAAMRRGTLLNINLPSKQELDFDDSSSHESSETPAGKMVTPPAKRSKFSVGDRIPSRAMPRPTMDEMQMKSLVSKLKPNDYAWIRRSGGYWGYSRVGAKTSTSMVFVVNDNGDTKTVDVSIAFKYVRIVNDENTISESAIVKADGSSSQQQPKSEDEKASQQSSSEEASRSQGSSSKGSSRDELEDGPGRRSRGPSRRGSDPPQDGILDLAAAKAASSRRRSSTTVSSMISKEPVEQATINRMQRRGSTGIGVPLPQSQLNRSNKMAGVAQTGPAINNRMQRRASTGAPGSASPPRTMAVDGSNKKAGTAPRQLNSANIVATKAGDVAKPSVEADIKMVQCKTEDGGTKMVPMYKAGMDVYYKSNGVIVSSAHILDVHLDDLLEPYYSIRLEDGREKQTDNAHITLTKEIPKDP